MLTGSSPDAYAFIRALARRTGQVAGFIVENNPLGRKWQTCMYYAFRHFDAKLYGISGSDDFLSSKLVDFIIRRHRENMGEDRKSAFAPAMYGTLEWLVCNINAKSSLVPQIIKCCYAYESAFEPLGAGRFYTRSFLEECKGLIFESDLERLLDDRGFFEVRDRGRTLEYYAIKDGPVVSIKGNWEQMNKIGDFIEAQTLTLEEFSFEGYSLLRNTLSRDAFRFVFRSPYLAPQLHFSAISSGLEEPK